MTLQLVLIKCYLKYCVKTHCHPMTLTGDHQGEGSKVMRGV